MIKTLKVLTYCFIQLVNVIFQHIHIKEMGDTKLIY